MSAAKFYYPRTLTVLAKTSRLYIIYIFNDTHAVCVVFVSCLPFAWRVEIATDSENVGPRNMISARVVPEPAHLVIYYHWRILPSDPTVQIIIGPAASSANWNVFVAYASPRHYRMQKCVQHPCSPLSRSFWKYHHITPNFWHNSLPAAKFGWHDIISTRPASHTAFQSRFILYKYNCPHLLRSDFIVESLFFHAVRYRQARVHLFVHSWAQRYLWPAYTS